MSEYPKALWGSRGSYKWPGPWEHQMASGYFDEQYYDFFFVKFKDFKKLKIKIFENDHFHCMVSKGYSTQGFSAKTKSQQFKMAEQQQY